MITDRPTKQRAWVSLERGPTQNWAYAVAGLFVFLCIGGVVYRAVRGLPLDAAFFQGMGQIMAIVAVFTALTTPYLKSWRVKYDPNEIVEGYSLFGLSRSTSYPLSALSSITSYHADPTMLGIPFDTLIFASPRKDLRCG
jgi:hypothetical protein